MQISCPGPGHAVYANGQAVIPLYSVLELTALLSSLHELRCLERDPGARLFHGNPDVQHIKPRSHILATAAPFLGIIYSKKGKVFNIFSWACVCMVAAISLAHLGSLLSEPSNYMSNHAAG
jgi:hypothetical protein